MSRQRKNALIVDWDYFFPIDARWDWGFSEHHSSLTAGAVWMGRAGSFAEAELPRTLPWEGFWERFRYSGACELHVADSNRWAAASLTSRFGHLGDVGIWLFDQHHDCGYKGNLDQNVNTITCENWMVICGLDAEPPGSNLHVLYPTHRIDAFDEEPEPILPVDRRFDRDLPLGYLPDVIDHVFVCRSGAWVPPWCDEEFCAFVDAAPMSVAWESHDLNVRPFLYPGELNKAFELLKRGGDRC